MKTLLRIQLLYSFITSRDRSIRKSSKCIVIIFFPPKHNKSKLKQIDLRRVFKPFHFDIVLKFWEVQLHDSDLQAT